MGLSKITDHLTDHQLGQERQHKSHVRVIDVEDDVILVETHPANIHFASIHQVSLDVVRHMFPERVFSPGSEAPSNPTPASLWPSVLARRPVSLVPRTLGWAD